MPDDDAKKLAEEAAALRLANTVRIMEDAGIEYIAIQNRAEITAEIDSSAKYIEADTDYAKKLGIHNEKQKKAFIVAQKKRFGTSRMQENDRIVSYFDTDGNEVRLRGKLDKDKVFVAEKIIISRTKDMPEAEQEKALWSNPFSSLPQKRRIAIPADQTRKATRKEDGMGRFEPHCHVILMDNIDDMHRLRSAVQETIIEFQAKERKAAEKQKGDVTFEKGTPATLPYAYNSNVETKR